MHSAPVRFLFNHDHQALTVPLAAQLFLDPHQAEIEPAPTGFADHAADNFLVGGAVAKAQALFSAIACVQCVVFMNVPADACQTVLSDWSPAMI